MAKHLWGVSRPSSEPDPITGVIFPNNSGAVAATQFKFTGANLIQLAPATYIFRVKYAHQNGYYTNFFFEADSSGSYSGDSSYFGCHPYPYPTSTVDGTTQHFEISAEGTDTPIPMGGVDDNSNSTLVTKDQWYTQAVVISLVGGKPLIKYYWDLGTNVNRVISKQFDTNFATLTAPNLTFGSSPWDGFNQTETLNGRFRGLQLFADDLSPTDMQTEAANHSVNTPQTAAGLASVWYMNQNPTPDDITDKSGEGHDPAWLGAAHGTLFTE